MKNSNRYVPPEQFKDYTLSTTKSNKRHLFYQEKIFTLPQKICKKLKTVSELLESLYPGLTDDFSKNIKATIKKNVEILLADLGKLEKDVQQNPSIFNTKDLKTNQHCINQMRSVCDNLQTVSTYEYEFKKLGKIKHALTELEHLIQPTIFEQNYQEAKMKSKSKPTPASKLKKAKKPVAKKPIAKKPVAKKKVTKPKKLSATKAKPQAKKATPKKSKPKKRAG